MAGRVHAFMGADSGADACKACGNPRDVYLHNIAAPPNLVPLYRQDDDVRAARLRRFVGELVDLAWEPYSGGDLIRLSGWLVAAPTSRIGPHITLAVLRLSDGREYAYSSAQVYSVTKVVCTGEQSEPEV